MLYYLTEQTSREVITLSSNQRECTFEQTVRLRYLLFLPQGYDDSPGKKWPLILFLHGVDERGDDLELVKKHGIAKIVEGRPDFPFIAISPQCPDGTLWWDHHHILKAILERVVEQYAVDARRIYLTGLSMGGYGVWSLAMTYPWLFAALSPICGGGMPGMVSILKDVPVWAFHGEQDPTVRLQEGQRMVDALRACGGNVRFTVYPGVGHDSWTQTYANPELYQWFLQHKL
jgi:predicted peptidase